MNKIFNLEHQYQTYLARVRITEKEMHPVQRKETRQAFMGACGQILVLLRDDLAVLEEDEGIEVMHDMIQQVMNYFNKASEDSST